MTQERRDVWENRETPVTSGKKETKDCRVRREKLERMVTGASQDLRGDLASEVMWDIQDLKDSRVKRGTGAHLVHLEIYTGLLQSHSKDIWVILVTQVPVDLLVFKALLDFLDQTGLQVTHQQLHMVPKVSPVPKETLGSLGMFIQDYLVLMEIPAM